MTNKDDISGKNFEELFDAISKLNSVAEVRKFMRDLCSRTELETMAERWDIVKYLKEGIPYRAIAQKTGASTATITRVAQWLHHGMGGYELMLNRVPSRHGLSKATDIIASNLKNQSHRSQTPRKKNHRPPAKNSNKAVA